MIKVISFHFIFVSVSSIPQVQVEVEVAVVASEVLTPRAFRGRLDRSRQPAVEESAPSWNPGSRSWSSARKGTSSSSCRAAACRDCAPRTNGGCQRWRSQALDGAVKRRAKWRRNCEEDMQGLEMLTHLIFSKTTFNNFTVFHDCGLNEFSRTFSNHYPLNWNVGKTAWSFTVCHVDTIKCIYDGIFWFGASFLLGSPTPCFPAIKPVKKTRQWF